MGSRDPITPDHQQMNASNDHDEARRLREAAPETAMDSRRQRLAGSAVGVGSVGFDEPGAYDVGDGERDPQDDPVVRPESKTPEPER